MQSEALVAMFESLLTHDESVVTIRKAEPYTFAGRPGVRFEYERIRKSDNVQLLGVGYGAVERVKLLSDSVRVRSGTWGGTIQTPNGPMHIQGYWATTDLLSGGLWKIQMETDNTAPSPPPPTR
jgi:hypothetical protein